VPTACVSQRFQGHAVVGGKWGGHTSNEAVQDYATKERCVGWWGLQATGGLVDGRSSWRDRASEVTVREPATRHRRLDAQWRRRQRRRDTRQGFFGQGRRGDPEGCDRSCTERMLVDAADSLGPGRDRIRREAQRMPRAWTGALQSEPNAARHYAKRRPRSHLQCGAASDLT